MRIEDLNTIGSHIRQRREAMKMTQAELAEKADLSLPFISFIENDKRNISLETLIKITNALEITLSDFFTPIETSQSQLQELLLKINASPKKEDYIQIFHEIIDI